MNWIREAAKEIANRGDIWEQIECVERGFSPCGDPVRKIQRIISRCYEGKKKELVWYYDAMTGLFFLK